MKRQTKNSPENKQTLYDLIERITPLNNRYRDLVKTNDSGSDVLVLMWQVGDMLDAYINENGIKPHALYWKIYGKAEGVRTSYITRDFLSYCLRIKRYFKQVSDIRELFPSLRKYSLFRGAFPLLENNKYKLNGEQEARIIKVLNSKQSIKEILLEINNVKHSRIGIRNTRTQKLN